MTTHRPWVIAHRGASLEAPENTLPAFERAIGLGADLIEVDVRQTSDGHIVAIHDETVDRTTDGSGAVRTMTLQQVRQLDAGRWRGAEFAGMSIPTLAEVLDVTAERVKLALEIKAGSPRSPGLEAAIVQRLQNRGRVHDVILISEDCQAIKQVRRLDHRLPTACFRRGSPRLWRWYRRLGLSRLWISDYLFAWPEKVTAAVVEEVHRTGLKIITSLERSPTIDPAEVRRLAHTGIDGIITNDIATLVRLLREHSD
jgi:glycerophosphoryl diester phosphodiesterase